MDIVSKNHERIKECRNCRTPRRNGGDGPLQVNKDRSASLLMVRLFLHFVLSGDRPKEMTKDYQEKRPDKPGGARGKRGQGHRGGRQRKSASNAEPGTGAVTISGSDAMEVDSSTSATPLAAASISNGNKTPGPHRKKASMSRGRAAASSSTTLSSAGMEVDLLVPSGISTAAVPQAATSIALTDPDAAPRRSKRLAGTAAAGSHPQKRARTSMPSNETAAAPGSDADFASTAPATSADVAPRQKKRPARARAPRGQPQGRHLTQPLQRLALFRSSPPRAPFSPLPTRPLQRVYLHPALTRSRTRPRQRSVQRRPAGALRPSGRGRRPTA
jgi:hypothetical protein